MSKTEKAAEVQTFQDTVREVAHLKTQFDVIRFMKRIAESYGYRTFMVLNLPPITSRELSENTIITNWPAELMSLFDRHGLMQTSVVLRHLRDSTLPVSFDFDAAHSTQADPAVRETFMRFGIHRSSFFPVHEPTGIRGAVSFGGSGKPLDHQQTIELMYLSIHIFQRLAEIRTLDVRTTDVLTEREIDCLNWTAAGKTSAEIADILGLSEHTVNHYLNRAARKLDTVNRTQAVAKALRTGLIK